MQKSAKSRQFWATNETLYHLIGKQWVWEKRKEKKICRKQFIMCHMVVLNSHVLHWDWLLFLCLRCQNLQRWLKLTSCFFFLSSNYWQHFRINSQYLLVAYYHVYYWHIGSLLLRTLSTYSSWSYSTCLIPKLNIYLANYNKYQIRSLLRKSCS